MSDMQTYDIPEALESHFQTDPDLAYIEGVNIGDYPIDPLPEFENWAIQISTNSRDENLKAVRTSQIEFSLDIVCIVRNFHPRKSIIGKAPGEIGILKMVEDVALSIRKFLTDNIENLDVRYDETSKPVDYKTTSLKEREGLFREHILPFSVRLNAKSFD